MTPRLFMLLLAAAVLCAAAPVPHLQAQAVDPDRPAPLRLGVVGLVHGHVTGFLNSAQDRADVQLVGIAEADPALTDRYAARYGLDADLFFADLEQMLDRTRPEAVAVFTSTYDHRRVVEAAAARGVHVMMEKPLAVDMEHARAMAQAAEAGGIYLLVNYETTWYPNTQATYRLVREEGALGQVRRVVVHDGHPGPKEIGVSPEFLAWLTDPVLNGGGALTDFGCYGANLITWLMDNRRPLSVTAVTQQLKADTVYARVDDEATILLVYPEAQGIIQASWNWPFHRKDMEVYGETGSIHTVEREDLRLRVQGEDEALQAAAPVQAPFDDPLSYLRAVVRGQARPDGLSSLENNLVVTEILDAARRSASTGETVWLDQAARLDR